MIDTSCSCRINKWVKPEMGGWTCFADACVRLISVFLISSSQSKFIVQNGVSLHQSDRKNEAWVFWLVAPRGLHSKCWWRRLVTKADFWLLSKWWRQLVTKAADFTKGPFCLLSICSWLCFPPPSKDSHFTLLIQVRTIGFKAKGFSWAPGLVSEKAATFFGSHGM